MNTNCAWRVRSDGSLYDGDYEDHIIGNKNDSCGFRPSICIDLTKL